MLWSLSSEGLHRVLMGDRLVLSTQTTRLYWSGIRKT